MRAQTRASAAEGFSTNRKSWLALRSPGKSAGRSTMEAPVAATSDLYFGLPRNVRSPGAASASAARPRTVSAVEPRVAPGRTMAAISAGVNDTCMGKAWEFQRPVQFSKRRARTTVCRDPAAKNKSPARRSGAKDQTGKALFLRGDVGNRDHRRAGGRGHGGCRSARSGRGRRNRTILVNLLQHVIGDVVGRIGI